MQAVAEQLEQIFHQETSSFLPLRVHFDKERKVHYFASPYELLTDDLTVRHLEDDPTIVHFQMIGSDHFKRHLLHSTVNGIYVLTASGYLFTGPIEVFPWKSREPLGYKRLELSERRDFATMALIDAFHVKGDKENQTAGLPGAIEMHRSRVGSFGNPEQVSLENALKVYNAMRHHVPKF